MRYDTNASVLIAIVSRIREYADCYAYRQVLRIYMGSTITAIKLYHLL